MGVSLVGAITGTVAWYQYSTRSTVSFVGTSIRSSENLQIAFDKNNADDFSNDKTAAQTAAQLAAQGLNTELLPVTTGEIGADDALPAKLFANPVYQRFAYNNWVRADANAYVQFTVYLKLNKVENNEDPAVVQEARKVYLSDLLIQDDASNEQGDISDAIRVHLHSDHADMLLGKNDADTDVFGALDLNNDGHNDTVETIYSFTNLDDTHEGVYGTQDAVQAKHKLADVAPSVDANGKLTGDHYLGTLYSKALALPQGFNFDGLEYFEENGKDLVPAGEVADGNKVYYVHELVELQGQVDEDLPERTIYSDNDFDAALTTDTKFVDGHHYYVAKAMDEQPVVGQIMNDGAVYFEDDALDHQATGVAAAAGTFYVSQEALPVTVTIWLEGWHKLAVIKSVKPAQGTELNDHTYFTDKGLTEAAPATADGTSTYYYSEETSAMWDALNYVSAKFDVGMMFEVDA